MHDVSILLTATGLSLLAVAALHDVVARTIPNAVPLALAGAGVASRVLAGDLPAGLGAGAAVFCLAALAWRRGWMGGGDVKLLGAAGLAVTPALVPAFVLAVAMAGGVLALLYLAARRLVPAPAGPAPHAALPVRAWRAECWRIRRGGPVPYAVAITAGAATVLLQGGAP